MLMLLTLDASARADEPPDTEEPPVRSRIHEVEIGEPQATGISEPAVAPEADHQIVFRIGQDVTYAPAGTDAPLLGNLEIGLTTVGLSLGYATVRSWHLGYGGTALLQAAGEDGARGETQACAICVELGWNVYDLTRNNPVLPGRLTFGLHMDDVWVGAARPFLASCWGADVGYVTRQGPFFARLSLGLSEIVHDGPKGQRIKIELDWFARVLGPMAIYGRLAAAEGWMDFGDGLTYDFGSPILSLGLAYVSR